AGLDADLVRDRLADDDALDLDAGDVVAPPGPAREVARGQLGRERDRVQGSDAHRCPVAFRLGLELERGREDPRRVVADAPTQLLHVGRRRWPPLAQERYDLLGRLRLETGEEREFVLR